MTHTPTVPLASTWSEAMKHAVEVTAADLVKMLEADDNPAIYQYRRSRLIAMNLRVHCHSGYVFFGFEYCDRAGYTRTGTCGLDLYSKGRRPVVFQFDDRGPDRPGGYFYTNDRNL